MSYPAHWPEAQRATVENIVAANPGSTVTESGGVLGAVIVSYPEGSIFMGAIVDRDGNARTQGFSSSPAGRAAQYRHMIDIGSIDPNCPTCVSIYGTYDSPNPNGFGPSHKALPSCKSGGRNHCTCDSCF